MKFRDYCFRRTVHDSLFLVYKIDYLTCVVESEFSEIDTL